VTANPYAVRALEKATRRRCNPEWIARNHERLLGLGSTLIPYIRPNIDSVVHGENSRINTEFFIDHSELPFMLKNVSKPDAPWTLGELREGWEWLAFTFQGQQEIGISETEIEDMLQTSDAVAKHAYSRMRLIASQRWAQHTAAEVSLIVRECRLAAGSTVLDIGCGSGRHVKELARKGIAGTGVDYLSEAVEKLMEARNELRADFVVGDARDLDLGKSFEACCACTM